MRKKALICGVSGQDGAYLARLLINKNYVVYGTSRDIQSTSFIKLEKLGIRDKVTLFSMAPEDFRSVLIVLQSESFDEIYFLAGQSSVALSFNQPADTMKSISLGTLNLLEAARMLNYQTRIYFAGSSEIFGDTNGKPANEKTPFRPKSPYAIAKASSFFLVDNYRESYGLFVCTGILFNHESCIRPEHFVTQKIVSAARRIASGSNEILELGCLDISRDWGWAPDYVVAMWQMLQLDAPEDFVISSGKSNSLKEFVRLAFNHYNLDWEKHVRHNPSLLRPSDIFHSIGDSTNAQEKLGWRSNKTLQDIVLNMANCEKL